MNAIAKIATFGFSSWVTNPWANQERCDPGRRSRDPDHLAGLDAEHRSETRTPSLRAARVVTYRTPGPGVAVRIKVASAKNSTVGTDGTGDHDDVLGLVDDPA